MTRCLLQAGALACLLFFKSMAFASTVADEDRVPIDLRRTTLIVSDIDKSLAFYRDALGMVVTYDNMVNTPRDASIEDAEKARRLVFLRANDDYVGVLGLLQYLKPIKEAVDVAEKAFQPGTTVMVFNHSDVKGAFERASRVEGANVLYEPAETQYPSYDGKSTIRVLVSVLQDPDGFTLEVNEVLSDLQ